MSRCLVTGAAGFIGSAPLRGPIDPGPRVIGVDAFIPYYRGGSSWPIWRRRAPTKRFTFHELDLRKRRWRKWSMDAPVVFHEAAMAGLMRSLELTLNSI
jgi:nucleoside-diphosphate-sugar epimerase